MSDSWVTKPASEVRVGDRIRSRQRELTVYRIEENFLGREGSLAFIEDSPERWFKIPAPVGSDATYEVRVLNRGTCPCTGIQIIATMPDAMEVREVLANLRSRLCSKSNVSCKQDRSTPTSKDWPLLVVLDNIPL